MVVDMDKKVILILGGVKSGKSRYALERARTIGKRRLLLATSEAGDDEMKERIEEHRKFRGDDFFTLEEPIELEKAIGNRTQPWDVVVVDCLTLWLNNLFLQGMNDDEIHKRFKGIIKEATSVNHTIMFVSNEVGMGIVPDNHLARRFRDLSGYLHRLIAEHADEVVFMIAGKPLFISR